MIDEKNMMKHVLYKEDIQQTASLDLPWGKLKNTSFLITGASGLFGRYLIDLLMYKNIQESLNCKVIALGRNTEKAKSKFLDYWDMKNFEFISHDINKKLELQNTDKVDYVLHLASNTHPVAYATDPIGTMTTNIIGTKNLLDFSVKYKASRFAFASSNEIYGENRGDVELFDEHYCGYIDCNTLRAGYPESKRSGEALCQAYARQKNLDIVIPRFTRSYGPTMLADDTKAISQFIKKGLVGENIVLKSEGNQYYSYTYVSDAISGLMTVILKGESGEAYNIADEASDIKLKDLAQLIADLCKTKVIFELPDENEKVGYSQATKARLDGEKLRELRWKARYSIESGVEKSLQILKGV